MLKFFENPQISFRKIRKFFDVVLHSSLTFYIAILRLRTPVPLNGDEGDRCTSLMKDKKPRKINFPALFFYSKLAAWWEFGDTLQLNNSYHRAYQHIVDASSWLSFYGGFHGLMIHGHIFTAPFLLLLYILSENLYRTCLNICANLTN